MDIGGAKILVTGGAGLIGSTTIDLILRDHSPAQIVILDDLVRGSLSNIDRALKDRRVKFVRGDVCDASTVRRVTEGMDAVIHLAALRITACAAEPRRAMEVMCDGSFNIVDAAQAAGVSKIVAATNWQNAIKASDLMSNDRRQIDLERNLRKLDYQYLRKRQSKS